MSLRSLLPPAQLLLLIADEIYSCRFGTFLMNCEQERREQKLDSKTVSIWSYIDANEQRYRNPFYNSGAVKHIFPSSSALLRQVRLWEALHMKYSVSACFTRLRVPDVSNLASVHADAIRIQSAAAQGRLHASGNFFQAAALEMQGVLAATGEGKE